MRCGHYYNEGIEVVGYKIKDGRIYTVVACLICGKKCYFNWKKRGNIIF